MKKLNKLKLEIIYTIVPMKRLDIHVLSRSQNIRLTVLSTNKKVYSA